MDSRKPNRQGRRSKISIETYLEFFEAKKQVDLTVDQLNHIICIHGFKKLHKTVKTTVIEALDKIDLISLSRSTLNDNISSSAVIAPNEAIDDLNTLNWQECTVTSFEIINPSNNINTQQLLSNHNTHQHQQQNIHSAHQHQQLIIENLGYSDVVLKPKSAVVGKKNVFPGSASKKSRSKVVAKETSNSDSVHSVVIGSNSDSAHQHQQPSFNNTQQDEQLMIENTDHSNVMLKPKTGEADKESVCPLLVSKKPKSKVAAKETSNLDSVRSVVAKNARSKRKRKALHEIVDHNPVEVSLGDC